MAACDPKRTFAAAQNSQTLLCICLANSALSATLRTSIDTAGCLIVAVLSAWAVALRPLKRMVWIETKGTGRRPANLERISRETNPPPCLS
jgi:hypothetical protein